MRDGHHKYVLHCMASMYSIDAGIQVFYTGVQHLQPPPPSFFTNYKHFTALTQDYKYCTATTPPPTPLSGLEAFYSIETENYTLCDSDT